MSKQRKTFPWLASLEWGQQYSSVIDSDTGGKVHQTIFSGEEIPMSDADKDRLSELVMLLPLPKNGTDDYHIHSEQVFAQKRVFSFKRNPAHPSAA